jgi:hypothetical protein
MLGIKIPRSDDAWVVEEHERQDSLEANSAKSSAPPRQNCPAVRGSCNYRIARMQIVFWEDADGRQLDCQLRGKGAGLWQVLGRHSRSWPAHQIPGGKRDSGEELQDKARKVADYMDDVKAAKFSELRIHNGENRVHRQDEFHMHFQRKTQKGLRGNARQARQNDRSSIILPKEGRT